MMLQDQNPHVSDEQIRHELFNAGGPNISSLREVFGPGMLAVAKAIGNFVAESANSATLQDGTHYHPINRSVPYTSIPPIVSLPLPTDTEASQVYVRDSLNEHARTTPESSRLAPPRLTSHEEIARCAIREVLADGNPMTIPPEQWAAYTQAHAEEHARDFCSLVSIAADVARRKEIQEGNTFLTIERYLIGKYLTYQYPESLTQITSSPYITLSYIRMPKSKEIDDAYAERLVRAAGFIMDWCGLDRAFESDMVDAAEKYTTLICKTMVRTLDQPKDELRAPVRSLQEGIGRSILPAIAEILRSSIAPSGRLVRQLTSLVPLGYVGPVGLQGVGLNKPVAGLDINGAPRISNAAQAIFEDMQAFWRRHYHYPLLMRSVEPSESDMRTGVVCPFSISMRDMPDVVSTFTDLILFVASKIDDRPTRSYNEQPYRPADIKRVLVGVR